MKAHAAARTAMRSMTAESSSPGRIPEKRVYTSLRPRVSAHTLEEVDSTYRMGTVCLTSSSRSTAPSSSTIVALANDDPAVVSSPHQMGDLSLVMNAHIISQSIPTTSTPSFDFSLWTCFTVLNPTLFAKASSTSPSVNTCTPSSHPASPRSR